MSVIANASGYVTGKFTLPSNTPIGTKGLVFVGDSDSQVVSNFFSDGVFSNRPISVAEAVKPSVKPHSVPPIAQFFSVAGEIDASGVRVYLQSIGDAPVSVQLRDGDVVLAESLQLASALTAEAWCDFDFALPVTLFASKKYSICVFCGDGDGAVGIRTVGDTVTAIDPLIGELRTSLDGVDFAVSHRAALAFKVKKAVYTQPLKTINMGSVSVTNVSRLAVFALVDNAVGGAVGDVVLTLPDASTLVVDDGRAISLPNEITGTINVARRLRSTATHSAKTCPGAVIVAGQVTPLAYYISVPFRSLASGCDVRVTLDAELPVGSDITVYVSGTDIGDNWVVAPIDGIPIDIGGGLFEYTFVLAGVAEDFVRVRVKLEGTEAAIPVVRNLRVETGILSSSAANLAAHVAAAHPHAPYKRHADSSQVCKVANGVALKDAVNVEQLDIVDAYLQNQINDLTLQILNKAWPLGSIYENADDLRNPSHEDLLGFGTWVPYAEGRTTVGYKEDDDDFGMIGDVGGSKTQTLDDGQMPPHVHGGVPLKQVQTDRGTGSSIFSIDNEAFTDSAGGLDGVAQPFSILQPFVVSAKWKRTG